MSILKNKKSRLIGLCLLVLVVSIVLIVWRNSTDSNTGAASVNLARSESVDKASRGDKTSGDKAWGDKNSRDKTSNASGAGGSGGASGAGGGGSGKSGKSSGPVTVSVASVQVRDVPLTISATAQVVSAKSVDLRAFNLNTVETIHVKSGQTVHANQLLISLDTRADQITLDKAQAQLSKDEASLKDLQRQKKRHTELQSQGFVTQAQADTIDTQIALAQATVAADQAAIKSANLTLQNDLITAPFAGRLGAINVSKGAQVQAGAAATPLVTISQIDPIEVQFSLPEKNLYNLRELVAQGAPVQINLSPQKSVESGDVPKIFIGKISFVDNRIDPQTGLIRVNAQVSNPKQALWPGQYVTVRLTAGKIKAAKVIPTASLMVRDGSADQADVYVLDATNTIQKVSLSRVRILDDVAIVDGLDADARVVVRGRENVRPAQKVLVSP